MKAVKLSHMRATSVLSVLLLRYLFPITVYTAIFYGLLHAHYIIQFLYSGKQIKKLAMSPRTYPYIGLVLLVVVLFPYHSFVCLTLIFVVHNALSEIYVSKALLSNAKTPIVELRDWRLARLVIEIVAPIVLFSKDLGLPSFAPFVLIGVLLGCFSYVGYVYRSLLKAKTARSITDLLIYEAIGIGVVCVFRDKIGINEFILYHLIWWLYFPLSQEKSLTSPGAYRYIGIQLLFSTVIGWIYWLFVFSWIPWSYLQIYGGVFHFGVSLMLSRHNPTLARRVFLYEKGRVFHRAFHQVFQWKSAR